MRSTGTDEGQAEEARVRLVWPDGGRPRSGTSWSVEEAGQRGAEADVDDPGPTSAPGVEAIQPWLVGDLEPTGGVSVRRAIVDAYDRLSDRLLQRLGAVQQDMGADIAELRSEVSGLRRAIDEMNERMQVRSLRSSVDDLRREVSDLAASTSLDPVLDQLAELRAEVRRLADRPGTQRLGPLAPLVKEIATLRASLSLDPVLDELAALRSEVAVLKRRLVLRAAPPPS